MKCERMSIDVEMVLGLCLGRGGCIGCVTCIVSQRELHEDVCQRGDIMSMGKFLGFADCLVGLAKVPAPFMLEGCSYVGQHCAGDVGLIMADAIRQYPVSNGPELLHVTGDFLSPVELEGDGGDD